MEERGLFNPFENNVSTISSPIVERLVRARTPEISLQLSRLLTF